MSNRTLPCRAVPYTEKFCSALIQLRARLGFIKSHWQSCRSKLNPKRLALHSISHPKQQGSAWHGTAFGFISRTLTSRAVLDEEPVLSGTNQLNQVEHWFYMVTPCLTNQELLVTAWHGSTYKITLINIFQKQRVS